MAIEETKGGTVFTGDDVKNVFVVTSLAKGLRLYAKSGIKPNSNWTPSNMLKAAGKYTGKTYKRGEYEKAAEDLEALAAQNVAAANRT